MKLISILALLFLSGCTYQVRIYHLDAAKKICEQHSGILHVFVGWKEYGVRCQDGHYQSIQFTQ